MKIFKRMKFIPLLLSLVIITGAPIRIMAAQSMLNLGTTSGFAVLAGSTITNTGTTTINGVGGKIGLYPGTSFTGQETIVTDSAIHLADQVALDAKNDLITAYDDAAGRTPVTLIPTELGGMTLTPGVYASTSGTFGITGTLTLDAQGDPDGVFIFQTRSTLITANDSEIVLKDGAGFCRTFWQVGSSATLGTNSHFVGRIFAMQSITANTNATIQGQLLARNGGVTLDSNTITNGLCLATPIITVRPVEPVTPDRPDRPTIPLTPLEPAIEVTPLIPLEPAVEVTPLIPLEPAIEVTPLTPQEPTVTTTTITGGELPETSSNAYNFLLIGGGLISAGALGWRRKSHE